MLMYASSVDLRGDPDLFRFIKRSLIQCVTTRPVGTTAWFLRHKVRPCT